MEGLTHYEKEIRPWGNFERFTLNESSTVKIITVNPESPLSLQSHQLRDEFWRVVSGSGTFRVGDVSTEVHVGDTAFIPRLSLHRATGGPNGLTFLEIAFGEADENDITRYEDQYGRA